MSDQKIISNTSRNVRVFLCHSKGDKSIVRDLYHRLRNDDIEAWLDEEDLVAGQDWELEISRAVRAADVVVVCLSKDSVTKAGFVQKEIKLALDVADTQPDGAIFLIPLKLEECEVPERLRRWQWVNLFEQQGYTRLVEALSLRFGQISLIDAITPFTKGKGLVVDNVRTQRYDVAARIVERARQLASEQTRPITPPPLKFIVPFLEKASTETNDKDLAEMWARLLVDASDEFQGVHLTYVQILSEISGFEARYLDNLAKNYDIDFTVAPSSQMREKYQEEVFASLSGNPYNWPISLSQSETEKVHDFFFSFETSQFCKPIIVSIPYVNDKGEQVYASKGAHATTAYLLQRQDLLAIESINTSTAFGLLKIELACLTPLGADFIVACIGR